MASIKNEFLNSNIKNDLLSGFIIALVLIPEAIVFSVIIGVSPLIGLYTACILGLITAFIGGKSGAIAGLTGAVAVIFLSLSVELKESLPSNIIQSATQNGELSILILQYILVTTLLAGIFQVLIGVFKLAQYIRLIPNYILFGLVNGLAIMTIVAQFYTFESEGITYYLLVAITLLIIYYFSKISKMIPSTFIAFVLITSIVIYFDIDTKRIGDLVDISTTIPAFSIPKIYINFDTIFIVLPYALLITLVSSVESLITLNVLDEMQHKDGKPNQEIIALGTGNIICSFFGASAGSSMLSQSVLNFSNSAYGRFSTLVVSILLIVFMIYFSGYISLIPLSVLIGILISVPIFIFQWQNNYYIKDFKNNEKIIIVLVAVITIFASLEIAFILSISIAFIYYLFKLFSVTSRVYMEDNKKIYELYGPLYKYNVKSFLKQFDIENDSKFVVIDFKYLRVIDQEAIDAIDKITILYKKNDIILRIRRLSNHCKDNSKEAAFYCEYNEDDPIYKVAIDK